jgi:NADPH-dependent 2,4-dienoyl-CoA reductase/sulfur reductase-like enzyme
MAQRLVVIGGDGGGMAAATVARRRNPDLEIVALERGRWTSYSACGIPYLVAGAVGRLDDLVVRTPEQFRSLRIDARTGHEVLAVDVAGRRVEVRDVARGRTYRLAWDLLHIATGARPKRPDVPGADAPHVHGVQTLADAERILDVLEARRPKHVVIVGSGYIGLEMAEAFLERRATVTVVEAADQVMTSLDADMAALVARALRAAGVTLRTGERVVAIEAGTVHVGDTSPSELPADLVVLGTGVEADSDLAAAAGAATGVRGGIVVDRRQRTSLDGVWAAGDCCQVHHLVSGCPTYAPLGTVANKQARVAGINLAGGYATFPGVVGTAVTRICSTEVARTGLGEHEARTAGFVPIATRVDATTIAGYLPDAGAYTVKLVAESGSGRVLGGQIVGAPGSARRIDVVAAALHAGFDVEDLLNLDLGYAPPIGPLWEGVALAARRLRSELS